MGWAGKVGEGIGRYHKELKSEKPFGYEDPSVIKLSECLRQVICYNQGAYAQYNFLAAKLHQCMKDGYRQNPNDTKSLAHLQDGLLGYLAVQMKQAYLMNIEYLLAYFKQRNPSQLPRISIKINEEQADPNQNRVVCLVRDNEVMYDSMCATEENCALQFVKAHGREYLCNNIPGAAKEDGYVNPRLDSTSAQMYSPKKTWLRPKFWQQPSDYVDKSWINCWSPVGRSVPANKQSCYKSTLVVPMTLLKNDLDPQFVKMFGLNDVQRFIFGYLCVDHTELDYFREAPDVDISYIFADIMSQYLLTELTYTKVSSTYNEISEVLNNERGQAD